MKRNDIEQAVLNFIAADAATDAAFNMLALEIFRFQFDNNEPFQRFCLKRGQTPNRIKFWRDIPSVPIEAFKELTLSCAPLEEVKRVFATSGTTKGVLTGKSYHSTLAAYDASMVKTFGTWVMQGLPRINMGILYPNEQLLPCSSLAHYLSHAMEKFGTRESKFFMRDKNGVDFEKLFSELKRVERVGMPYALLGASYSFLPLIEELARRNLSFSLPKGSRLFDTGGFKGRAREIDPESFYTELSERFGVPRQLCINMYGMTELSTQFYDRGNAVIPSVKSGPHWVRTRVVDPLTGNDVPAGEVGVLVHCDLAHFNIVSTVLTEDVGFQKENGFVLLGRVDGAEAKGCSMAVEEFLRASRN